jgi:ubiquinone/menaquinone biosynthesis C-methylase UbiE
MPPLTLRYRVAGTSGSASAFDQLGHQSRHIFAQILQTMGYDIKKFENILDFGVGCGRTMRWMMDLTATSELHGADIDEAAIEWCRRNLSPAQFIVNQPLPPLPYSDETFDLIYSVSVFTHINEMYQNKWLEELNRVSRPGSILLITVHNVLAWEQCLARNINLLSSEDLKQFEDFGTVFVKTGYWDGIFPKFYQSSYHTRDYIKQHWNKYFEVLNQLPYSVNQDCVVLRKAPIE